MISKKVSAINAGILLAVLAAALYALNSPLSKILLGYMPLRDIQTGVADEAGQIFHLDLQHLPACRTLGMLQNEMDDALLCGILRFRPQPLVHVLSPAADDVQVVQAEDLIPEQFVQDKRFADAHGVDVGVCRIGRDIVCAQAEHRLRLYQVRSLHKLGKAVGALIRNGLGRKLPFQQESETVAGVSRPDDRFPRLVFVEVQFHLSDDGRKVVLRQALEQGKLQ